MENLLEQRPVRPKDKINLCVHCCLPQSLLVQLLAVKHFLNATHAVMKICGC